MDNKDQIIFTGVYFPQLDLYKPFHDYTWARDTIEPLISGTRVESIVSLLLGQWLKASAAFRYPSLMMDSVKATSDAYLDRYTPYTNMIIDSLKLRMQRDYKSEVTVTQFNKLIQLLELCKTQLNTDVPHNDVFYDRDAAFQSNLNVSDEFKVSLIAITEQAFCSIYFAYELFIKRSYQLLTNDFDTRATHPSFSIKLKEALKDDSLHATLWTCDDVRWAKQARHALAHADGDVDSDFKTHPAYYHIAPATDVERSRMNILTPGVHVLYQNLKDRAEKLIRQILANP